MGEGLIRTLALHGTSLDQEITVDISLDRFMWEPVSGFRVQYRKWRLGPVWAVVPLWAPNGVVFSPLPRSPSENILSKTV